MEEKFKIKKIKPKRIPFQCPVCNGFGTLKNGTKKCQACSGLGYVVINQERNENQNNPY